MKYEGASVENEIDWTLAIANILARDWSDPREDIYTLEDGEPIPPPPPHDWNRTPQL